MAMKVKTETLTLQNTMHKKSLVIYNPEKTIIH